MSPKKRVLFICTGNICRSPLAHAVFEHQATEQGIADRFEVESAGTHGYHVGENADSRMRSTSASRGVRFSHRARRLMASDIDYYDYLFVMDRGHLEEVNYLARREGHSDLGSKLRMFREFDPEGSSNDDVPDPYYGGQSGFENVYDIVERTSLSILEKFQDGSL